MCIPPRGVQVTETQAKQIELDKTAEEFRALHRERQALVRQWQEAIEAMRRRDDDIANAGKQYAEGREELRGKREVLAENAARLKTAKAENVEAESRLTFAERVTSKKREEAQRSGDGLGDFRDNTEVLRNELSKAAADLTARRSQNANRLAMLEERRERLELARKRYQGVKRALGEEVTETGSAEAQAKAAELDYKEKDLNLKLIEKDIAALKEQMFKQSQELFRLRQAEANQIAEISGAQAATKNLRAKIHKLDQDSLRQQELIYNAEFQIQQLERRVSRASGERSDEEKVMLNAKIAQLQGVLEGVTAQNAMLKQQVKRLGDELRASKRRRAEAKEEHTAAAGAVVELQLVNSATAEASRASTRERQETLVQHDILRLEVKRLRDALNGRADEVFGLENRRFQLQLSMEERKREIGVHREVQRAQAKAAEEERHHVAIEAKERAMRVDKLKAKYATLVGAARGSDAEEVSQAFIVIAAAQKREELQREGDELDGKIRKAEKEIRALEATLKHLNVRNTDYRLSFHAVDQSSAEAQTVSVLEADAKAANDKVFKKRRELQRLQADRDEDARRLAQLREQHAQLSEHVAQLRKAKAQVAEEVGAQSAKLARLQARARGVAEALRADAGVAPGAQTLDEVRFDALALRETTANVLFTLGQLAREFPEMSDPLRAALAAAGLQVPPRPPSRMDGASELGGGLDSGGSLSRGSVGFGGSERGGGGGGGGAALPRGGARGGPPPVGAGA
jgi:chromosome segregation ATPase